MDSQRLLAEAFRGDQRAFEELVRTQAARLYRVAYRVTGDRETADDVLQETFLRLLSTAPPAAPIRSAPSWLARVAARVAINILRSQQARSRREERYAMERKKEPAFNAAGQGLPPDLEPRVSEAFQALPPETRAALWLNVVEEEGVRQVALCLGSSRSAVSRRIREGLDAMRRHLKRSGCVLPAAFTLEGSLRALPAPAPAAEVLEAVLARGNAAIAAAGPGPVDTAAAALKQTAGAGGRGKLLGGKKAALSAGLSLTVLAGLICLVVFWNLGGTPDGESHAREAEGISPLARPPVSEAPPQSPGDEEEPPPEKSKSFGVQGTVVFEGKPVAGTPVRALRYAGPERSGWTFERLFVRGEFGAFLDLAFQPPDVLARARTDGEGRFRLALEDHGAILLEATRVKEKGVVLGGLHPLQVPEDTGGKEKATDIILELFADQVLSGIVMDSEGNGVAGAAVATIPLDRDLYLACAGKLPPSTRRTELKTAIYAHFRRTIEDFDVSCTTTDPGGNFLIPGLDPADCHLVAVRSRGHACAYTGPVELPARGIKIVLQSSRAITGEAVCLPEGTPAAGARILVAGGIQSPAKMKGFVRSPWFDLLQPNPGGWFDVVKANAQGRFSAAGGKPGIEGFALGCLDKSGAVIQAGANWNRRRPLEEPLKIEFRPALQVSSGKVLDAGSGRPIAGARIQYYTGRDGILYVASEDTTAADGAYSLPTWREGLILAEREGYAPGARGVHSSWLARGSPEAQATLAAGDIVLTPTSVIRGTVVGPHGNGVPECFLEVIRCTPTQSEGWIAMGRAAEQGALAELNFLIAEKLIQEQAWILDSSPASRGQAWTDDRGRFEVRHPFGQEGLFLWAGHAKLGEVTRGPIQRASGDSLVVRVDLQLPGLAEVDILITDGAGGVITGIPIQCREDVNVAGMEAGGAPAEEAGGTGDFLRCLERWRQDVRGKERAYRVPPQLLVETEGLTDSSGQHSFRIQAGIPFEVLVKMDDPELPERRAGGRQWSCSLRASRPLQVGEQRLLEIPFPRDRILKGRVIDGEGNGLPATLSVRSDFNPDSGGGMKGEYVTRWTSGEDGSFEIRAAGTGPFGIDVHARGFRPAKLEDLQSGAGEITIRLESE